MVTVRISGKIPFIAVMLFTAFILAACGGKKMGDPDVFLGGEVIEKNDKIIVKGQSNLLEGARVNGEVLVDGDELFSETSELVDKKGNFKMELEHPVYGEADVQVTFNTDGVQEEEILEHYGENGEKLEGPYTYIIQHWDVEDMKQEARVDLSINEDDKETKHEFTAPDWGERPKDYGDPRVWVEVEEVTNDGEYFYITGKSNLLEGSLIKASHSNSAETRVNPDGTFNVEVEYKYEEDKPITIKFQPFNQWGNVIKNYGENGEKLVGNLVVRDGSYLYIEYPFEYEE